QRLKAAAETNASHRVQPMAAGGINAPAREKAGVPIASKPSPPPSSENPVPALAPIVPRRPANCTRPRVPSPVDATSSRVPNHGLPAPAPGTAAARVTPAPPTAIASHCRRVGQGTPATSGANIIHQKLPAADNKPARLPLATAIPR